MKVDRKAGKRILRDTAAMEGLIGFILRHGTATPTTDLEWAAVKVGTRGTYLALTRGKQFSIVRSGLENGLAAKAKVLFGRYVTRLSRNQTGKGHVAQTSAKLRNCVGLARIQTGSLKLNFLFLGFPRPLTAIWDGWGKI